MLLLLALCVLAPAGAQQSPPSPFEPLPVQPDEPLEVQLGPKPDPTQGVVRLDVTVTDTSGEPVAGLKAQNFALRDNGQPTRIVSFQAFDDVTARPDRPVEVILVIDELNMSDAPQHGPETLSAAEDEAENFLRQNHGHLRHPVSIYRLTRDGLSASPQPSTDGNALADEIAQRRETHVIWKTPTVAQSLGDLARAGLVSTKSLHSLIALVPSPLRSGISPAGS